MRSGASTMMGARLSLAVFLGLGLAVPAAAQDTNKAAPASQQPKAGGSQDEDPRAKAVREAYEEQLRRQSMQVTIKVRNATVDQIVSEFRRQTSWNIVVDRKNIPDDYRIDEFIVEKEQARRALEAFAAKAELSIEDVSTSLIMLSRPPRLTFNFRDADIKVVIDMIARVSGANIIISPDVKGTITLSINNVPWSDVLNAVVKTLNYTTVKESFGIIRIIHPDELLQQMEVRVFPLKYIVPPSTYTPKVQSGPLIEGQPMQPATSIQEVVARFILVQTLQTVLSRTSSGTVLGTLNFDPQSSALVVRDTKLVLDKVEEIVRMLDVEPDQVVLDVKFISTSNRDLLQFGTNWSLGGNGGLSLTSSFLNPSSAVPPAGGAAVQGLITKLPFGLGSELPSSNPQQYFLTNYDMTMAMRAFKNDRYSKTVQEPSITVVNNHEATLFVGDTISYPEVSAVTGQLGGIEFSLKEASKSPVKTGFQLYVVPKIVTAENKVLLTIIPQFTFLSGALENNPAAVPGFTRFSLVSNGNPQSIDLPRVKETTVVSKMVVENGRTAVLGGLITETSSYADQGIPVLKDLPIISYLFKSRTDDVAKEYLLIFITPRIVRSGTQVAEGFQQLLRVREESERAEYERMKKESQEQK